MRVPNLAALAIAACGVAAAITSCSSDLSTGTDAGAKRESKRAISGKERGRKAT
jgi:hypothetical protein